MNTSYEWLSFGKDFQRDNPRININTIVDIMGAPISTTEEFKNKIDSIIKSNTILCISGELKRSSDGRPSSNYRFEDDDSLNENVIQNYFYLIQKYKEITKKPIFVTTIPRELRKYSWFLTEEGTIIRKDQEHRREGRVGGIHYYTGFPGGDETSHDKVDEDLMNMLYKYGIDSVKLKIIRESCKNSRYHSYMIDMISFIYQTVISEKAFHYNFKPEYRIPSSVLGGVQAGRWMPKETMNYLYFEDCNDENGQVFFIPKEDSINHIYHLFELIIDPCENKIKGMIRNHLRKFSIYRWTDFDANDTDDAFTILMILHCYSCDTINHDPITLTSEDYHIKKNLESIINSWKQRNSL